MANKRMFSNKILQSAKFLKMPSSTQALYFHLGMNADDDGVVEAFAVMRIVGSADDDLKILIAKGFIIQLNQDEVCFIVDWLEHNSIRADRKVNSIYQELLTQTIENIKLIEPKQRSDRLPQDGHGTDMGQQKDGIDKSSIDKNRLEENSIGKISVLSEVINYFNLKTNKSKYQKGSERATLQKYIQTMIKNGDTLDTIKNLIDYKLANPNTQKIDLLSWLTPMYVGKNISDAESWNMHGRQSIAKYNDSKAKQSNHDLSKQDYSRGAEILGHRVNDSEKPF